MEIKDSIIDTLYHDIGKMATTFDAEAKLLRRGMIPLDYERLAKFCDSCRNRMMLYRTDIMEMIEKGQNDTP